jgi:hypothetical protein
MATLSTTCAVPSCGQSRCVSFEGQNLCRSHFLSSCYRRLEGYSQQFGNSEHLKSSSGEAFIGTLAEIVDQATTLGLTALDLDGLEQAQLLDILFTAGNLMKNLRRSIRKYVSIPLKLLYEVTGHNWIEESRTLEVSLHGASIECRIPIAKGEMMTVERVDNHKRAQVKVRWHRRKADGSQMLGIELLDSNDFWEFNRAYNEVRRQEA